MFIFFNLLLINVNYKRIFIGRKTVSLFVVFKGVQNCSKLKKTCSNLILNLYYENQKIMESQDSVTIYVTGVL